MSDSNSAVPAVDRADTVLQMLASSSEPVSPADLALHTGLANSTLYLLLTSLDQRRWIEQNGSGYVIGIGLYMLGFAYVHFDNLQLILDRKSKRLTSQHHSQ